MIHKTLFLESVMWPLFPSTLTGFCFGGQEQVSGLQTGAVSWFILYLRLQQHSHTLVVCQSLFPGIYLQACGARHTLGGTGEEVL